jgi:hypothetical protein
VYEGRIKCWPQVSTPAYPPASPGRGMTSTSARFPSHTQSYIMNTYWIYISEALVLATSGSWREDGA